jgi:hypothetical protein
MRRREFIGLLGGAVALPALFGSLASRAQQAERLPRVGVLMASAETSTEYRALFAAFNEGLNRTKRARNRYDANMVKC